MNFSERYGHKPLKEIIQLESVDEPLRNGLWSLLKIYCWDDVKATTEMVIGGHYLSAYGNEDIQTLCKRLWVNYFKEPLDQLSNDWDEVLGQLRRHFFECKWHEVYDFIEFIASNYPRHQFKEEFMPACNRILEKELSAYRFVNGIVTRITDAQELAEIEQAIELSTGPVVTHLRRSLELLSDRNTPDYRNSVKESISAVESMVGRTVGEASTLGQLIKKLEQEIGLHPALKNAFSSLYGYTSDEGGIRHALMEAGNVDFSDAKFMLVVCSAFVNFVEGKVGHEG